MRSTSPHKLAQGKEAIIKFLKNEPLNVQIDGEPNLQPPGCIRFRLLEKASLLTPDKEFIEEEKKRAHLMENKLKTE